MKVSYDPDKCVTTLEIYDSDKEQATPGTALSVALTLLDLVSANGNHYVMDADRQFVDEVFYDGKVFRIW